MKYNFDKVVNRRDTDSIKWGNLEEIYGHKDMLPMWIADMDFRSADEIIDVLKQRVDHGVFGYTWRQDSFYDAVINWVKERYDWDIKKEWILFTPGVVMGLNIGVRELINPGEKVVVQPPVYPPFYHVLKNNGRIVDESPLLDDGDKFIMDYDDLEEKLSAGSKLMMLCNPQNPVGRVWTEEELKKIRSYSNKK